jgi:integrase
MTRIKIRFVQAWVDSEGRAHHYFRRRGFERVRLPGLPGSPEFNRAYEAAFGSGATPIGSSRNKPGSVSAAIASYYGTPAFKHLAPTSQEVRRAVLEKFRREHGDKLLRAMPTKFLRALLDAMEPTTAKNWLAAIRALTAYAIKADLIETDPTLGIKLRRMTGDGFHSWDERQIAQFEQHHPIGSRERLAFALGLYSGQRRGDVIRMGRQHLHDCHDERLRALGVKKMLFVRQQKTGKELMIPVHPELQAILDLVPSGQLTFIMTLRGKPFDPHAFSPWFGEACDAAGLPSECVFHGLRKAACRRLAEAGCTAHEIMAISGHTSLKEIERYTKAADQKRLAQAAMARAMAAVGREQSRTEGVKPDESPVSNPLRL